jgi:lysophospholipase L1-like esterase
MTNNPKRSKFKTVTAVILMILTASVLFSSCKKEDISADSKMEVSQLTTEKKIPITNDNVKFHGRVVKQNNRWYMDWTNTGIEFTFVGTDAFLTMGPTNAGAYNFPCVAVYVNDQEPVRINELKSFQKIQVAKSLPYGTHTVKVLKVSESTGTPIAMGEITINSSEQNEVQLLAPPAASDRKILFFGDSITAGYGNLGKPDNKNFYTYEQDGMQTYASLTAKALSADAHYICISGRGVFQSLDGGFDNVMPRYIDTAVPSMNLTWDATAYTPDLIVINLGTNDSWMGVSNENFETAAKNFLGALRERYPEAKILWCYGIMGDYYNSLLTKIMNEFNSEHGNASYFLLETADTTTEAEGGANGHPNVAAHQKRASALTEKIKEVMSWN